MDEVETSISTQQLTPEQITALLKAEKIRWENRRRMAWTSLAAIFIQTFIILFAPNSLLSPEKIQIIKEPLTWAYMCESAVILGYMGFTTWAYMKEKLQSLGTPTE
jgi:hypothetical protein